jgi:hypothetical protein
MYRFVIAELKKKYKKAWDAYIEPFFQNVGFISHYELVADIFGRLNVFEHFPDQQGFFMHLLQLIKDSEEDCPALAISLATLKIWRITLASTSTPRMPTR